MDVAMQHPFSQKIICKRRLNCYCSSVLVLNIVLRKPDYLLIPAKNQRNNKLKYLEAELNCLKHSQNR